MPRVVKDVTDLIGNTPLPELFNYAKNNELEAQMIAKLEYFNPAASIYR